ncbi:MAG: glycosyltransferase family 2 protein [Acidimicrobiales bacterium]|nr:glycosyltransferase family 2 protein [Acidimicrobiales bacterium]
MSGRIVLCCGMPRSASTLQYQLARFASERRGTTVAAGWYDGTPLPELASTVPDGETWIYKVHNHRPEYRFEEAAAAHDVLGLSTWRDIRKVIASYRELHGKSMWWVARHQVLEILIRDHRRWSEADGVLMQRYDELTGSTATALAAIAAHLDVELSDADLADATEQFDRRAQHQRTESRRGAAGIDRPDDLLLAGHVAAQERATDRSLDTAWVESIGGSWLRAQGFAPTTSRAKRVLARIRFSPRLLWFALFQLRGGGMAGRLLGIARRVRSAVRRVDERRRLAVPILRRTAARLSARMRTHEEPGHTVVLVSWNSEAIIADTLRLVRHFSPPETRILVVDNGSHDATREIVGLFTGVDLLALRRNIGHGLAMDLGFLRARTEYCIALDVDAFPISPTWIADLQGHLDAGAVVAGAKLRRHVGFYIHPCCLMMRRRRFVSRRHSFESRFVPGVNPKGDAFGRYWDTGERISMREGTARLAPIPLTERGPNDTALVFGDLVYHNGATARAATAEGWAEAGGANAALQTWRGAVERFDPAASNGIDVRTSATADPPDEPPHLRAADVEPASAAGAGTKSG